jgi:hypothetical protein
MARATIRLHCSGPDGQTATVTSERAARDVARRWLGVSRVTETPTERGWQLWPMHAAEDSARAAPPSSDSARR